ncbi:MAG: sensor histidine kinase, partial [Clostridia bacterium]|nr:sensor histidine kinase [Clostridia bacterium]
MKAKSFGVKLWTYFALFTAVIFCILWLLQTVFLQSFYNKMEIRNISNCAAQILNAQSNDDNFKETIDDIAHKNALLVIITDFDGNVMYSADEHKPKDEGVQKPPEEHQNPPDKPQNTFRGTPKGYNDFLTELSGSNEKTIAYESNDSFTYGAVLDDNNILYISKPLDSIEGTINILFRQLVWVTLASLAFGFILSYFVSRRFSKPIKAI